jgi:N-acetylneuraminic acid mutarotase
MADMKDERKHFPMLTRGDGYLYAFGGHYESVLGDKRTRVNYERYDLASNTWTMVTLSEVFSIETH